MAACRRTRASASAACLVLIQGGKEDQGVPQVGIAVHRRDGQQAEPLVGVRQPLQGVGQHLAQDLVDPGRRGDSCRAAPLPPARPAACPTRPCAARSAIVSASPSLQPVALAGGHLDLGEGPHEALDRVEDLPGVAGRPRHGGHAHGRPLPPVLVVHLGRGHREPPAGPFEDRSQHRPLLLEGVNVGQVQLQRETTPRASPVQRR